MSKDINKRIAILEMFKAGKSSGEISKTLNLKNITKCWSGGPLRGMRRLEKLKIKLG